MNKIRKALGMLCCTLAIVVFAASVMPQFAMPVQAATVKINKKSATIKVGKSVTLKITGTSKKVTWSSSKKSIATVSSKGKVTGVAPGTTTITAKVGGKKYTCKVNVKFDSTVAKEKIDITYEQCDRYTVAYIVNNNKYKVSIEGTMIFYDDAGSMISTSSDQDYCLEAGKTCALLFYNPTDENYNAYIPATYKLSYTVKESYATGYSAGIKYEYDFGNDGIVVEYTNDSGKDLEFIPVRVLMYDSNGKLIDAEASYAYCEASGSQYYTTVYYPYDSNYDPIIPDHCKIIINGAYTY